MNASGVATAVIKKYQKKLAKVMKLTDIITSALAVFRASVSKIDKWEFNMLYELYYKSFNNLPNVDHKMEAENTNQIEKSMGRNQQPIEGTKKKRCPMMIPKDFFPLTFRFGLCFLLRSYDQHWADY